MGLHQSKTYEEEQAEKVKKEKSNDIRKIYWDAYGNLRVGETDRNRDEEILNLLKADTIDETDPTKLWMIIPSRWVRQWLLFAHIKAGNAPGPIDMWPLLKEDPTEAGGWRPLKTLLPPSTEFGNERPGHYRRVSFEAWCALVDLYGIEGYAIAVKGIPYDDKTRWRVFKNPKFVDVRLLPDPILPVEVKQDSAAEAVGKAVMGALTGLFGGSTAAPAPAAGAAPAAAAPAKAANKA